MRNMFWLVIGFALSTLWMLPYSKGKSIAMDKVNVLQSAEVLENTSMGNKQEDMAYIAGMTPEAEQKNAKDEDARQRGGIIERPVENFFGGIGEIVFE